MYALKHKNTLIIQNTIAYTAKNQNILNNKSSISFIYHYGKLCFIFILFYKKKEKMSKFAGQKQT